MHSSINQLSNVFFIRSQRNYKGEKDEHEVEYWINPQRQGNVREPTAKPSFILLSESKYFTVKL